MSFESDDKIQQIAQAHAEDAIDYAKQLGFKLDWSDDSIRHVETMLAKLYREMPNAKPTDEQVFQFAKMFGSYVGEVFRRNHHARWGVVTLGDQSFPGLEAERTKGLFWPWGKVQNRLKNGPEGNVWHYYCVLRSRDGFGPELTELDLSAESGKPEKPWWRKVFGGA